MAYIVLARKWRPMKFEEVVGQDHVTRTLVNSIKQQRIAHSYIFSGPRGVGKTTTARLLAKAVNCQNQPAVNPCNECETCREITNGSSLDVIEIDGASNRGIDEIRNLRENIRFAPAAAKYKIYIIDEVHMLTKEAFNALLKTLEEPPAHAIFIFATTEIHKVPLTILSRCQRFDFRRIPTKQISEYLSKIAREEKIEIDPESLFLIARKAEGGMRDAESILDQLISYTDGKITADLVRDSLGLIHEELYFKFTDLVPEKNDGQIIEFVQQIFREGHDPMDFLYGLENHFRNFLVCKATGKTNMLDTSDYYKEQYLKQKDVFNEKDLLHYVDILTKSENLLKYSPNPQLILELLLLKIAHKPLSVDLERLLQLVKSGGSIVGPGGSGAPSRKLPAGETAGPRAYPGDGGGAKTGTATAVHEPKIAVVFPSGTNNKPKTNPPGSVSSKEGNGEKSVVNFDEVKKHWPKVVEAIKKSKIALGSFLQDSIPNRIYNSVLEIAFDNAESFHLEHVKRNQKTIETVLREQFHWNLNVECVSISFAEKGIKKNLRTPDEVIEDIKEKEPVLKKIVDLFDCENLNSDGFPLQ